MKNDIPPSDFNQDMVSKLRNEFDKQLWRAKLKGQVLACRYRLTMKARRFYWKIIGAIVLIGDGCKCLRCGHVDYGHRMGCRCWPHHPDIPVDETCIMQHGSLLHDGSFLPQAELREAVYAGRPVYHQTGKRVRRQDFPKME